MDKAHNSLVFHILSAIILLIYSVSNTISFERYKHKGINIHRGESKNWSGWPQTSPLPVLRGQSPSDPQFFGFSLLLPTLFNSVFGIWRKGVFLGVIHASHHKGQSSSAPPILGFPYIYVDTLRFRTTQIRRGNTYREGLILGQPLPSSHGAWPQRTAILMVLLPYTYAYTRFV